MGIKYLNNIIKNQSPDSIKTIQLNELESKIIIIDISIYIFKFAYDGNIIDNFYILFTLFKRYNIFPIFVFDGKPPDEKKNLLIERRLARIKTDNEIKDLQRKLDISINNLEHKSLLSQLECLKKKVVNISIQDFDRIKELIDAYGFQYINAEGEADEVCAYYVLKGKAWACLSDDTDMFLYGCPRVLRQLNLFDESLLLYTHSQILNDMNLTQNEFNEICIYSGTDYNINNGNKNTLCVLFKNYIMNKKSDNYSDFMTWMYNNNDFNDINIDVNELNNIKNIFNIMKNKCLQKYDGIEYNLHNNKKQIDMQKIQTILINNGFIL